MNGLPLAKNTVMGRTGLTVHTGSGLESKHNIRYVPNMKGPDWSKR